MASGILTQTEAHAYLEQALAKIGTVKADRLLWGNREASWTATERHYRFDPIESSPAPGYRHRPGCTTQWGERIIVHLAHRMAQDASRTKAQASSDTETICRRLLTDTALRAAGIRLSLEPSTVALSDSGDTLETDIPLSLRYAYSLAEEVG
jgi:hypothetical protein